MPSFARLIRQAWSATVGTLTSKVADLTSSRFSKHRETRGTIREAHTAHIQSLPSRAMSKTVETTVSFNKKGGSTDEMELMEKESKHSGGGDEVYHYEHRYVNDW
jgi:hypothetical protein